MRKVIFFIFIMAINNVSNAGAIVPIVTMVPTVSMAFVATQMGDLSPIYNAKTEALNYTGGEVSATLQQGIDALDANYDTSKLSREEKIQHISLF